MGLFTDAIEKTAEVITEVTLVVTQALITATVVLFSRIAEGLRDSFGD